MWIAYLFMSLASLFAFLYGVQRGKTMIWLGLIFAAACVAAMSCVMSISVVEEVRRSIDEYQNDLCATIIVCLLIAGLIDRFQIERPW